MGSSSERSSAPASQLISRRTLVRAGATAAWSVPLVQVVAAAPAFAQGSGTAGQNQSSLSISNYLAAWQGGGQSLRVTGSVSNAFVTNATALTLTITLPTTNSASAVVFDSDVWTRSGSGASNTLTFTGADLVKGSPRNFDFNFTMANYDGGAVSVLAHASNAVSDVSDANSVVTLVASTFDVVKSDGSAYVYPTSGSGSGNNKTYVLDFRVRNNGPRYIKNAVVTIASTKGIIGSPTVNTSGGWTLGNVTPSKNSTLIEAKYSGVIDVNGMTPPANLSFVTDNGSATTSLSSKAAYNVS